VCRRVNATIYCLIFKYLPLKARGQGDKGTRGQGDGGTRGQGDKGTRGWGDKGMGRNNLQLLTPNS